MNLNNTNYVYFTLGDLAFEYDKEKNKTNIAKHGLSFKTAARVFFDYDRVEYYDEENSILEDRYNTIGDLSAGSINLIRNGDTIIDNIEKEDIIFVVYTERIKKGNGKLDKEIIRIISARYATDFERRIYYGKC